MKFSEATEPIDYVFRLAQKPETPCLPNVWSFFGKFLSIGGFVGPKTYPYPLLTLMFGCHEPQKFWLGYPWGSKFL